MKLTPTILFITATVLFLLFGILTAHKTHDIQLHDCYFIISNLYIAILISIMTGLTALIYFGLDKLKRPIKLKIGFWHFALLIMGLLLVAIPSYISTQIDSNNTNNTFENHIDIWVSIILFGLVLLLSSFVVFIFGLTKSLAGKNLY